MLRNSLTKSMRGSTERPSTVPGNPYAVEVVDLTAVYGRVAVLRNIGLTIAAGESVAVMGPNGAGKSTLLKCIIGAVRPASGRVSWFGTETARSHQVCRHIGYVGQESGLYPELTVLENLVFAGRMYGVSDICERAARLLAEAGLESRAHRPTGQLSQGMRQRLAIARALIHEPRLIVLDEPSSNLDLSGRQWLDRQFDCWRTAGQAVCFASHDTAQCRSLADRLVHLDGGQIAAIEEGRNTTITLRQAA